MPTSWPPAPTAASMPTTAASHILPRCRKPPCGSMRTSVTAIASRALPLALLLAAGSAAAYTVNISAGTRAIYFQVGNGSFTGTYSSGGTPGNNATVNKVTVSVPAASVGSGTAQAMTTDSTAATSFYDSFAFCNVPAQVYLGGFFRLPGATGTATLSVTTSAANLVNATGDT